MPGRIRAAYEARVNNDALAADPAQRTAAAEFDRLARQLRSYAPGRRFDLVGLITGRTGIAPKGIYLHGAVGRGKTMLMDLFCDTVRFAPKQRVHFHAFMQDVHRRIAIVRRSQQEGDPILPVAQQLAAEARLLCFDELQVTDIADAMILGRLFGGLFDHGVVIVATANVAPDELYRDGLNRALFLPFLTGLKQHVVVRELAAAKDYRQDKLIGKARYLTPLGSQTTAKLDDLFEDLTGCSRAGTEPLDLDVQGRSVRLPAAAKGVLFATFAGLCGQPLGTADYIALATAGHTLLLDGVPQLGPDQRNEARRLINLVDVLYDRKIRLIVAAEAEPDQLYAAGDGREMFERTASRLVEMRSDDYLRRLPGAAPGGSPA